MAAAAVEVDVLSMLPQKRARPIYFDNIDQWIECESESESESEMKSKSKYESKYELEPSIKNSSTRNYHLDLLNGIIPASSSSSSSSSNHENKNENKNQSMEDLVLNAMMNMRLDQKSSLKYRKLSLSDSSPIASTSTSTEIHDKLIINKHFQHLIQYDYEKFMNIILSSSKSSLKSQSPSIIQVFQQQQQQQQQLNQNQNMNEQQNIMLRKSTQKFGPVKIHSFISSPLKPYLYQEPNMFQVCLRQPYCLYEFQVEAVQWMKQIESGVVHHSGFRNGTCGGILALNMGQGKTICAVTLIASTLQEQRQMKSTSLYVCPLGIMDVARFEIEKFFGDQMKVLMYHPSYLKNKFNKVKPEHFQQFDIVLINYDTLKTRFKHYSFLFRFPFYRIFLDESQAIQNKKTKIFEAVNALQSPRRWCMSGTPFQNDFSDIFHQFYFCGLNHASLAPGVNHASLAPGVNHASLAPDVSHHASQNPHKIQKIKWDEHAVEQFQLQKFMFFKTEDDEKKIHLPSIHHEFIKFDLNPAEKQIHYYLLSSSRKLFQNAINAHTTNEKRAFNNQVSSNLFHGLMISSGAYTITKPASEITLGYGLYDGVQNNQNHNHKKTLDQKWIHLSLYPDQDWNNNEEEEEEETSMEIEKNQNKNDKDDIDDIETVLEEENKKRNLLALLKPNQQIYRWMHDRHGTAGEQSSKMIELVKRWKQVHEKDPHAKVIVFSSFKVVLQLAIQTLCRFVPGFQNQYIFVHSHTSTNIAIRNAKMQHFITNPSTLALFATYQLAGKGYNFTCANHIFLLDQWFNNSRIKQAIGRINRIGQTKEMYVTYFLANNSLDITAFEKAQQKQVLADRLRLCNNKSQKQNRLLQYVEQQKQEQQQKKANNMNEFDMRSILFRKYVGDQ